MSSVWIRQVRERSDLRSLRQANTLKKTKKDAYTIITNFIDGGPYVIPAAKVQLTHPWSKGYYAGVLNRWENCAAAEINFLIWKVFGS